MVGYWKDVSFYLEKKVHQRTTFPISQHPLRLTVNLLFKLFKLFCFLWTKKLRENGIILVGEFWVKSGEISLCLEMELGS